MGNTIYRKYLNFGTFPGLSWFTFVLKNLEKLCNYKKKKSKYWSLNKAGESYKEKVVYADNPGKS